jgi:hypothetical protein
MGVEMHNLYTLHCIAWHEGASRLLEVREVAYKLGLLRSTEVQPDDMEEYCRHALALSKWGQAVGCVRIAPGGKIERVAVLPIFHRSQLETALIETVLKEMLNESTLELRNAKHNLVHMENKPQVGRLAA